MIILLRVYKDERVIAAEAYDHHERPAYHGHPLERCRCMPLPTWRIRETELAFIYEGKYDKITATEIYLSRKAP